jgi:hypothetical protein
MFACPDIRGASQKTVGQSGDLDSGVDGRRAGCETEIAGRGVYKIGIRGEIVAKHQCALQPSAIHDIPAGIIERNVIYDFGIASFSIFNSEASVIEDGIVERFRIRTVYYSYACMQVVKNYVIVCLRIVSASQDNSGASRAG